jgi:hypothetical protein
VIAEPPLAGATNPTRRIAFPRVSVGAAGAEGVVAGTAAAEAPDGELLPTPFVATTVQVYVLPFVSADTTIGDVAPVFDPEAPPSLEVQPAV